MVDYKEISFILIGLIIGFILGLIFMKFLYRDRKKENNEKKKTIKLIGRKIRKAIVYKPIETVVLVITILILCIFIINSIRNKELSSSILSVILSAYTSIIFSWFLTKYSSEKTFNEKQKELAINSYDYACDIYCKTEWNIKVCELIQAKLKNYKCDNHLNCNLSVNLERIYDFLVESQTDAEGYKNTWAKMISDDLILKDEIEELENEMQKYNEQQQDLDIFKDIERQKIQKIETKIDKIHEDIKAKKEKMNSKVRYTIYNKKKNEHIRDIEEELKEEKLKSIQKNINLNHFKDIQFEKETSAKYNEENI